MLANQDTSKQKIIKLCNKLLDDDRNISGIFYELYPLVDELNINDDLKNFCSLIIDETSWIPQKEERTFCAEDFIKKINQEEEKILNFYKIDIKRIASQIIKEVTAGPRASLPPVK